MLFEEGKIKHTDSAVNGKTSRYNLPILFLAVLAIVFCSFFLSEPKYEITAQIIILFALATAIVLSDKFDHFAIAKVFTMSRKVSVQEAAPDEIDDEKDKEENTKEDKDKHIIDNEKLKELILKKHYGTSKQAAILRNVKVVEQFADIDPISGKVIVFDAFFNDLGQEFFVQIQRAGQIVMYERLYVKLNKVHLYRTVKKNNAVLKLLIAKLPDSPHNIRETFAADFSPATTSGLLSIEYVEIDEAEMQDIYKDKKKP